ncbi:MAG TPA: cyclic nucleotide-binding domain-containing protein [Azospirillaceae bacterium]|nr:cyclic nucleotide-binding domain-containing protein [Azospirillaceae bacterium]
MEQTFPAGAQILQDGQPGAEAYIVKTGRVEVFREVGGVRRTLGIIGPGAIFGEMALIDDRPRMASAVAAEPTVCMVVNRAAFAAAFNRAPPLIQFLLQTQVNSIRRQVGAQYAESNRVARGARIVSSPTGQELLSRQVFPPGRVILSEGEPGACAYLIQTGLVELSRRGPDGAPVPLRRMGPGCVFGEMSLVERRPRSATAVAVEPTVCEVVKDAAFQSLVRKCPPVIGLLLRAYIHHVHQFEGFAPPAPPPVAGGADGAEAD